MDLPPGPDQTDPERQADKQANEMKDQLRKEVALWNASRDDTSARQVAELSVPVAAPAPKPEGAPRKPFSMAFDGVTDAEHITYMIARGRR